MAGHLKSMLAEGDGVIRRLSKIAIAARPSQEAEPAAPMVSSAAAIALALETMGAAGSASCEGRAAIATGQPANDAVALRLSMSLQMPGPSAVAAVSWLPRFSLTSRTVWLEAAFRPLGYFGSR